ncbi:tigger transposable element-derived protein 6-like [Latimeria chalumnae]|uniref:tigger transposable element-derived protein 6-like n=1 Tax=Latimeria chalumnae TaxID=7897 RepID=UPI00313DF9A1
MEDALFMWFTEVRGRGAAVNDEMLLEKGRVLGERLGVQDFAYSKGWLANFKSRRGISHHRLHGEAASADMTAIVAGRAELQQTLADYSPDDIYNFDGTGLFYKLGPSGTLATAPVAGHKKSKERITVALFCNASGTDLRKPIVIARAKRPQCFGKTFQPTLYTEYFSNAKAWMTSVIFQEIICAFDRDLRLQGRHCILLLDNASSHAVSGLQLTNLKLHFLPPCTTSSIQPLDAGIIRAFKALYRRQLVQLYVNCAEEGRIQTVDLCQALQMIRLAWCNVTATTVKNCWHHTGILPCDNTTTATDEHDEDDMTLAEIQQLIRRLDSAAGPNAVAEYVSIDREVETMQELDDDTIVDIVSTSREESCDGAEDDVDGQDKSELEPTPVTAREACAALASAIRFYEGAGNVKALDSLWDMLNGAAHMPTQDTTDPVKTALNRGAKSTCKAGKVDHVSGFLATTIIAPESTRRWYWRKEEPDSIT